MTTYGDRKATTTDIQEHVHVNNVAAKRTLLSGYDGTNLNDAAVNSDGRLEVAGLIPEQYDFIDLGYTGSDLTSVTYKTGGSGGTTVATLTLAYDGGNLDTITRT